MKLWVPAVAVAAVLTVGGLPALTLALADDPTPSSSAGDGSDRTDPQERGSPGHGHKYGHKYGHRGRTKDGPAHDDRGLAPCQRADRDPGPPPWAGEGLTKPERQQLKDEHKTDRRNRHEECQAAQKQARQQAKQKS